MGGLTTRGLGKKDIGDKQAIGGIAREFYQQTQEYDAQDENWKWEKKEGYMIGRQARNIEGDDAMWTLAYHPRMPHWVRDVYSKWGMSKDEFEGGDGWQNQLYIREASRMISDLVMTQLHCEGLEKVADGIGLAAYGMDSHHIQRYVDTKGYVQHEGNVEARLEGPYPISYRAIIPKKSEAENLLVPVCVSASHIALGSIRMEPVFMILGQSAPIAASLSIDGKIAVQDLDYEKLKSILLANKQRLE